VTEQQMETADLAWGIRFCHDVAAFWRHIEAAGLSAEARSLAELREGWVVDVEAETLGSDQQRRRQQP
jgi:hypothetical protein